MTDFHPAPVSTFDALLASPPVFVALSTTTGVLRSAAAAGVWLGVWLGEAAGVAAGVEAAVVAAGAAGVFTEAFATGAAPRSIDQ